MCYGWHNRSDFVHLQCFKTQLIKNVFVNTDIGCDHTDRSLDIDDAHLLL